MESLGGLDDATKIQKIQWYLWKKRKKREDRFIFGR